MATIPTSRPFALGSAKECKGLVHPYPIAGSQTMVRGDNMDIASGLANVDNAADVLILGIAERTATNLTASTLVPITLAMPGRFYEYSTEGTAAATDRGSAFDFKEETGTGFPVVDLATAAAAGEGAIVFYYPGDNISFEMNAFVAQAGTSTTSGSTNQPHAATKGVVGDTDARAQVVFSNNACAFFT